MTARGLAGDALLVSVLCLHSSENLLVVQSKQHRAVQLGGFHRCKEQRQSQDDFN